MESTEANKKRIEDQTQPKPKQLNPDHPEQLSTDKESMLDRFESEQNVDSIPLEDLKIQHQDEKNKDQTKKTSSSPEKYKSGF
ncbi:hypothetical protein [Paenibacillus nasutitermitis]|uniref:Uncharacterized protein n=1 Tax=Paenibacillus nasutitermitis TaxID=1652958 RepID=A0A916YVI1_9BACL|nr:hypothetical protein [Paenibacillus nasutitermitis]GGD63007.1 hypothetical protein GCM10010911_21000 [Paenibacillus nasutitermitis]